MNELTSETQPTPEFSYRNRRDLKALANLIAPVAFIALVGLWFHQFVWHAISVNISINLGILGAAAFGVFLIVVRLLDAQKDFRIIERFGFEAKQGVYMKTLLEQPWLKQRYVRHYLSHIANTGGTLSSQLEHSAIESELHALRADYNSRLELPQFIVGFMIAMGLLGTFIGLLETLTGISGMLDHMSGSGEDVQKEFMSLVVELQKPLAGMGIAFSASMFGLITSLMLSIMMINLRRYISRTISLARNVMHELTELTRMSAAGSVTPSLSPTDVDSLLAADNEEAALASLGSSMSPENARIEMFAGAGGVGGGLDPAMAGRFDLMTKKLELLVEAISDNTEKTKKLNELVGYGPRMKEVAEKTLEQISIMAGASHEQTRFLQSIRLEIADLREVGIGNGRHLYEIKEIFTKTGKSSDLVELIASNIGGHTALFETMIEELRRSQQGLAIINRSIADKKATS